MAKIIIVFIDFQSNELKIISVIFMKIGG